MTFFSRVNEMLQTGPDMNKKWTVTETRGELEKLFRDDSGTHLIYKHSFSCSTCIFIKRIVEEFIESDSVIDSYHFIEVRKSRPLSNYVSEITGIKHESPQALLIHNGDVIWHASHASIKAGLMQEALKEIS